MSKKVIILITAIIVFAIAAGAVMLCVGPDYKSAKSLERAINRGKNVVGCTAKINVTHVEEEALFGLCVNYWAGEHLNFITLENYDIHAGDKITVLITGYENMLGSHLIEFVLQ